MNSIVRKLELYICADGRVPFEDWLGSIRDMKLFARTLVVLEEIRQGRFYGCRSLGFGLYERAVGKKHRVFFAIVADDSVILLSGGDTSAARENVSTARALWREFKDNAH